MWGGIAGAQTMLALLYDEGVVGRGLAPRRWPACSPRRRRGASAWRRPRARSRSGADADLVLVDPAATWTVAREDLLDRHRLSPFVGRDAARPRGAHDPARAHDRARRADRRRALRARGAARRLGLCAVSALDDAIAELARFNDDPDAGGITREVYTPTYATALEWVAERMRDAGLETRLDAVGNLFGRWDGQPTPTRRCVITGSHVDTTLNAGAYDGVVGVLGAIEAVRALRERGVAPRRSIEVVAFAGEEPRFGTGCVGSRAAAGELERADLDRLVDRDGTSMAAALREAGFDPDRLADARIDPAGVHAFVELHIEQGIVLETHGEQIGVVTAIAAPHDFRLTFRGAATHAGATPMGLRRDALAGAAEAMVALERAARESPSGTTVGTVGVLRARPGRDQRRARRGRARRRRARQRPRRARARSSQAIVAAAREIAARRGLEVEVDADRRGRAGDLRRGRGGRGAGGVPRARPRRAPDDQRRLPRRDDHGPPRARRHDLRPQRRRRQPPPRRVHRARGPRARRARAGRDAVAAGGLTGVRRRAVRLRSIARCVLGAARRLLPHRGKEEWRWPAGWPLRERRRCSARSLVRTASAFRNTFRGRPEGWPLLCIPQMRQERPPPRRLQRLL